MVQIIISGRGCRTPSNSDTPFRCSMCRPHRAQIDPIVHDNAYQCAQCRIAKGVIYYYHDPIIEKDPKTKKDKIVGYNLIEQYRDDYKKV